ncbi:MAG TPA: MotA/TolQ/ExbB proton channel family protein [Nevskiaceae bacterium]|nr:MotA/TolQ/ExbB proton channel family protein [Nevskiaceae bacterium]
MSEALLQAWGALADFLDTGGWVIWWLVAAGLVMWTLIVERWWWFTRVFPRRLRAVQTAWAARAERRSWEARRIRLMWISQLKLEMGATLPVMRVVIPMCPLLGLLGTVLGMLEVFDVMALKGRADPNTMASGVSHAMVCTLAGLAVSLSGMYSIHRFGDRVKRETERLTDLLSPE